MTHKKVKMFAVDPDHVVEATFSTESGICVNHNMSRSDILPTAEAYSLLAHRGVVEIRPFLSGNVGWEATFVPGNRAQRAFKAFWRILKA